MPEPIIIDGHAEKITITVPAAFKLTRVGDRFTVEVEADPGKPFEEVVVSDISERDPKKQVKFRTPAPAKTAKASGLRSTWHITIGRNQTETP